MVLPVMYRPVLRFGRGLNPDVQGRLPVSWCCLCGSEVFEADRPLCRRCARRKENGSEKSLPVLPAGGRPGGL